MRRILAIAGGIVGAIFSGASVWAFTAKHIETDFILNFPVQHEVVGYPELGALFLTFAILGFVIMVVGLLSKEVTEQSTYPQPVLQSPSYACPYCGQFFAQGSQICPKCNHEIKW